MKSVGIDIGTTSICGVLIDGNTGKLCKSVTLENTSKIQTENPWEKVQNPNEILEICRSVLEDFLSSNADISAVGVTGQMHGILYLDASGKPVSPLYTWQDDRGNLSYKDGMSYCKYLEKTCGYTMATGFGMATHFYNQVNHLISDCAVSFCSIPDFVAMSLGGEVKPRVHPSLGASFGVYDIEKGGFDMEALKAAGVDVAYVPEVVRQEKGSYYNKGAVPVSVALGDNQASFLGSVGSDSKVLINVGTGSQLSIATDKLFKPLIGECRPYINGSYLYVGSSLCGGYAYSMLHNFFKETQKMLSNDALASDGIYDKMNKAAEMAYKSELEGLAVNTQFKGTRLEPEKRGKISNIAESNFHPECLTLGVLRGICDELYDYFAEFSKGASGCHALVGSGNGIRKNPLLKRIVADRFECTVKTPRYSEEASFGSALFVLYCTGYYGEVRQLQDLIKYE